MADLIAQSVIDILKKLSAHASQVFVELYHLKNGIEELKSTLPKIEELLNRLGEDQFKYWLELAESARYDVEDLISSWEAECHLWEMKPQVRKLVTPFATSNLLSKHRISAELKRVIEKLDKIISEGRQNIGIAQAASSNNGGSQTRNDRESDSKLPHIMVGREDEKSKLIELLKDETSNVGNFSVIPIVGSGGMGKTFLAQLVYNHFDVTREHFDVRTWIWVTEDFDIYKIYMTIVLSDVEEQKKRGNLHPDIFSLNSAPLSILKNRVIKILSEKKFLIVLDDIWKYDGQKMQGLLDVFSVGGRGSKVLVTSRNREVLSRRESSSPNILKCLDEVQSLSLFKQCALKEHKEHKEEKRIKQKKYGEKLSEQEIFEKYGEEIVSRCQGLPLAIKTIGSLLCGKEESRWIRIIQSPIWEEKDVEGILPALRLSYNALPSRDDKKCFAYCGLFPKSYLFEKEELVKLWMAEGYVQPKPGQKAEDIGAEHFDLLLQRTLFQSTPQDGGKHRMHDLIHDLAQTVSQPFCTRVEVNKVTSFNPSENTRHVSLLAEQVEQPTLQIIKNSKRLHTLLFPVPHQRAYGSSELLLPFEDLRRFGNAQRLVFQSLVYMHVLDMSFSALQTLPDSIGEMKLLRYLDFSKTELKELPESICNLYHLQTLRLLGCPFISSLPKNFRFLVNLRHLELDGIFWFKVKEIPQSIGRLTNLHNLHKFQVGCNSGYKLEELKDMENLTGKLHISHLENAVNAGKTKKRAGEVNLPQVNAKEANLDGKKMINKVVYEWSNSELNLQNDALEKQVLEDLKPPPGITELRIFHYRGSEFPSWMGGGQLQYLDSVVLNDCNNIKILSFGKLPNLKEVHLKNMQLLEEWKEEEYESLDWAKVNEEIYQPLRRVTICNCPSLVKLPSCFSKLNALKIIKCKKLQNVPFGPMQFLTLEDNDALNQWGEENLQIILDEVSDGDSEYIPTDVEEVSSDENSEDKPEVEEVISDRGSEGIPTEVQEVILDGDNQVIPTEVKEAISDRDSNDLPTEVIPTEVKEAISDSDRDSNDLPTEAEESLSAILGGNCITQLLRDAYLSHISSTVRSEFSSSLINLKIVNCPALSALPSPFAPQKLEISSCGSLTGLPEERYAQRLILLALDSCQGDTLLGNIPRSPSLLNLMITNIKDVSCLPTFPEFPELQTLHIHDCPDLEYLSTPENKLFERFTCLETLSIKNCPKLLTLPVEGLRPTSLQYMNIGPCESLKSFGPPDVLLKLNSLKDLYIEGCPALQSLPKDGLSPSLQHLSIKACPLLMKTCANNGSDWEKIKDISDLEIEKPSSSSKPWYKFSKNHKGDNSK